MAHFTTRQTSSSTGSSWRICRRHGRSRPRGSPRHADQRQLPCATSPPINGRASRPARSRIRASVRKFCASIRRLHPEFSFLPRKFKIALTASAHDRAAVRYTTSAWHMHRNGAGEVGFEVIVGGGLGRTPFIGKTIKHFLPKRDLLSYVEAILRVYNQFGRRDNIYKARIKDSGPRARRRGFCQGRSRPNGNPSRIGALALDPALIAEIAARFSYPAYEQLEDSPPQLAQAPRHRPPLSRWMDNSVTNHKAPGYAIVTLSLKAGRRHARRCHRGADGCDRGSGRPLLVRREIRVGHEQNLVLPHAAQRDLPALWRALDAVGVATPECRARLRHHFLPGPRLLQPCQYALDSGRPGADPSFPLISISPMISGASTSTSPAASMRAATTM